NVDGFLYFTANDGAAGQELWRTDGTEAGTHRVSDIAPGAGSSNIYGATPASFGGANYFSANDGTRGEELWRSDGTEAGTILLKEFNPGGAGSKPGGFIEAAGQFYFRVSQQIWTTDGTEAGTTLVIDLAEAGPSDIRMGYEMVAIGDRLFFPAFTDRWGDELWAV